MGDPSRGPRRWDAHVPTGPHPIGSGVRRETHVGAWNFRSTVHGAPPPLQFICIMIVARALLSQPSGDPSPFSTYGPLNPGGVFSLILTLNITRTQTPPPSLPFPADPAPSPRGWHSMGTEGGGGEGQSRDPPADGGGGLAFLPLSIDPHPSSPWVRPSP